MVLVFLCEQRAERGRLRTHSATAAAASDSERASNEPSAGACPAMTETKCKRFFKIYLDDKLIIVYI